MGTNGATVTVTLGFLPESVAVPDPDHPGLRRAGERTAAPYGAGTIERHTCAAVDGCQDDAFRPDLLNAGFDVVDLSGLGELQTVLARVRAAGHLGDDDAAAVRSLLQGATLPLASGRTVTVLYLADEGFIMRKGGPNGLAVVPPHSQGANDHGAATSVHADQDVYGTPLAQLMDGRAPELFVHDSPDGHNHDAALGLVNLWIPLQQITRPLVLGDGRSVDRRTHQLRYGLATQSFLDRDDDMVINDIWSFLHDPGQQWYLRSEMDHREAYLFNTLSTPHGAGVLPGEDVAEVCYLALEAAEVAAEAGDPVALAEALTPVADGTVDAVAELADDVPRALSDAIAAMVAVAEQARRDPAAACGPDVEAWVASSRSARGRVVRMSLELRLVVSLDE